ncbi:hypothetical protein [Streptomyces canus]|uniref:hypothetical protein n=1 Tax=Streptomyces canus TaxID=58343 RepID=UPI0037148390
MRHTEGTRATRRNVLALGTAAAAAPWLGAAAAQADTGGGDLDELGITELHGLMAQGRLDAERLTRATTWSGSSASIRSCTR